MKQLNLPPFDKLRVTVLLCFTIQDNLIKPTIYLMLIPFSPIAITSDISTQLLTLIK